MTKIVVMCAWHNQNFGFERLIRTIEGHGVTGVSHGMCEECFDIEKTKFDEALAKQKAGVLK